MLQVAASSFGLAGCVGARIGNGVATVAASHGLRGSMVWWWKRGRAGGSHHFLSEHTDRLKLSTVFGKELWPDCTFVQFLLANEDDVQEIRRGNPMVPNIGGLDGPDRPPPAPPRRRVRKSRRQESRPKS